MDRNGSLLRSLMIEAIEFFQSSDSWKVEIVRSPNGQGDFFFKVILKTLEGENDASGK